MEQDMLRYEPDIVLETFSKNLRKLMENNNMNQKQFADILGISEPTLSGYIKHKKAPSFSFLLTIKKVFRHISLEQFLFDEYIEQPESLNEATDYAPSHELSKYKGTYYLFYLDTNRKAFSRTEKNVHETIDLKNGVLYISEKPAGGNGSGVRCLAVFGLKKRDDAEKIKNDIELLNDYDQIFEYLKRTAEHSIYWGIFTISQLHIFISLNKVSDGKDHALLVLHHTAINKDYYMGGLGTINSVSTGRASDPVVQLIALSKNYTYLSDEEIKSHLSFAVPDLLLSGESETNEIIALADSLHHMEDASPVGSSSPITLNQQNRQILIKSFLSYLITKNIESNRLWFGRVSSTNDDDWYHLLKESESYYKKQIQGEEDEHTRFDVEENYTLY